MESGGQIRRKRIPGSDNGAWAEESSPTKGVKRAKRKRDQGCRGWCRGTQRGGGAAREGGLSERDKLLR